jgi:hypothetical protein
MRFRVRANALKEENRRGVIMKTGLADETDIRGEESLTQNSCLCDTLLLLCPENRDSFADNHLHPPRISLEEEKRGRISKVRCTSFSMTYQATTHGGVGYMESLNVGDGASIFHSWH